MMYNKCHLCNSFNEYLLFEKIVSHCLTYMKMSRSSVLDQFKMFILEVLMPLRSGLSLVPWVLVVALSWGAIRVDFVFIGDFWSAALACDLS